MFDPVFKLTNEELASIIGEKIYYVDNKGFDTRPYASGGKSLLVSYFEWRCDRPPLGKYIKGGDVTAFLKSLEVNKIVTIPEYSGKWLICDYRYVKNSYGYWVFLERRGRRI